MAIIKERLHRKTAADTYDVIHLETSSDVVIRSNGSNVEDSLVALENGSSVSATGSFVTMVTSIPVSERKSQYLYGLEIDDFSKEGG